jgi:hypothetical protein
MAKLPPDFVKAPTAAAATVAAEPPRKKRGRKKTSLVTAERARDLSREVILSLGDDDRSELERARQELALGGEELTLEQMVQRVVSGWCSRRVAERARAEVPRIEGIVAQLRRLARDPVGSWRELGAALRRLAPARVS